jgi:hypothetical protein
MMAVHKVASPKAAPACEYVAIPDGSSSLAPVTKPGPSFFQLFNNFEVYFLIFNVTWMRKKNYAISLQGNKKKKCVHMIYDSIFRNVTTVKSVLFYVHQLDLYS